jgi:DNA repair photolyase|tara:strand:- start:120 stop:257 length:138 start_codon:yes stop_codon:yes gene_type:complete
MIAIKVTMNILDMLHSSEKDIVITTKRRLIKEDQKIILMASHKGF